MTNPQHIGLTAEQGLELIRSLPEREDNLSNAELAWLDEHGMWTTGCSVEGHEDISLIEHSAAAMVLLELLDSHTATAVKEERTRVESRIVHAITDLDVLKDDLIENTNEDDASPSLIERVRDIADDLRRATPQDQSGSAG